MNMPVPGAYPLPIGLGDAESLTYDAWVTVLGAETASWTGDASASYAAARQQDVDAARTAYERVVEAAVALQALHASRTAAFLAFQGTPPPMLGPAVTTGPRPAAPSSFATAPPLPASAHPLVRSFS